MKDTLILGTRKGMVVYQRRSTGWRMEALHFEGIPVSLAYVDDREGTWWACLDHGHWGVKLHRSMDRGQSWQELPAPAFPEGAMINESTPATTRYLWALAHGGRKHPRRLWVGTEPGGLFLSEDGGDSFRLVESLWNHPTREKQWFGGGRDYAGIHSIVVDPRDEDHLYVGISVAGVFETSDGGQSWIPRNRGLRADFLPNPEAEVGHDPHLLVAAPGHPEVLWQQNHCGIFRSVNGGKQWQDISQAHGPARFGFAIAVADDDPAQAWVAPAVSDERRLALGGALCICRTDDGGATWQDLRQGLPQEGCFDIVYRHALAASGDRLAFGTTTGNLFISEDRGEHWQAINHYLPMVYSVQWTAGR